METIEESGEEIEQELIRNVENDATLDSTNKFDFSFRPYYNKKTNRSYTRSNKEQSSHVRSSTRQRKAPDRYQA